LPASDSYKQMFAAQFPDAQSVPEWMPHPEGITEKIALNIKVTVGAGLPSNKAFIYQMLKDDPDITPQERRSLKREYLGLPIPETPDMPVMPPTAPQGAPQTMPNPNVGGLAESGAVIPQIPGGVA